VPVIGETSIIGPEAWSYLGSETRGDIIITNGLYLVETVMLDGVNSERRGIMVFRDGTMLGGGANFYTVGSYTCPDGKWKGDITVREHTPIIGTDPWARFHNRFLRNLHKRRCAAPRCCASR